MNLELHIFFLISDRELLSLLQDLRGDEDDQLRLPTSPITQTTKENLDKPSCSHQFVQQYFLPSNSIEPLSSNDPNRFRRLKGRKRACNVKKINELRIVKRDIRRRYIEMYNNVINIHDHSLLSRFLNDICTPTCSFSVGLPGTGDIKYEWKGIEKVFHHMMQSHLQIPDGVQCLSDGKIHVSLGKPGSRIISSVSFRGTLLYEFCQEIELERPAPLSSNSSTSASSSSSTTTITPSSLLIEDDDDNVIENPTTKEQKVYFSDQTQLIPPVPLNPLLLSQANKPIEIITSGLFTMVLDDTHRIEKFHVDIHYFSEEEISSVFSRYE